MKKLFSILFIGCICAFTACNNGNKSNSVDSAQNINDSTLPDSNSMNKNNDTTGKNTSMSSAPVSQEDADWAAKVANANMTEIELSKVAQDKATNDRLKNFASMMVTDHTKAGDQLKQLAATKNITLPANLDSKSQKELDNLNKKKVGKDFDKAYQDDMLDDHKGAVDAFQKGSTDLKDADLKNFAGQTLATIRMHQDSIKAIAGKKY